MEEQIGILRDAVQTQGSYLPSETPMSAPAPALAPQTMARPRSRNVRRDTVLGLHYGPEHTDPG
jgi:hypothetical protein